MTNFTKIIAFTLTLFMGVHVAMAQQSVGVGTNTPDVSARLDINASDKGLLIPKIFLLSLSDAATIATPANGLMLYNTNKTLTGGLGFYYNSGTSGAPVWTRFQTGASSGSGWGLTGNAGTDSTTNFLGTTDVKPLVFRLNNGYAGQLGTNGGIAFGRGANGTSRITPGSLIAIGDSALFNNQDSSNIAIGEAALYSNTIGSNNTAIGNASLASNIEGVGNVAVGDFTLSVNDSSFNTAVGYGALNISQDVDNTAVGAFALSSNLGGFFNSAVGSNALSSNDFGLANTSFGYASMASTLDGRLNTAAGFISMVSNTTGDANTAYGSYSLRTVTTGSFNTAIGDSADISTATLSNTTAIGYKATATASNTVRIGNTAVTSIGGQVNWSVLSDGRYKKNVNENIKGLDFILQLRPVSYQYDFEKIRGERYGNASNGKYAIQLPTINPALKLSGKGAGFKNAVVAGKSITRNHNVAIKNANLQQYDEEVKQNDKRHYTGFIAQEVEAAAIKAGYDFSGVDKPKNENDQYALRYAEFVVPLVKAVQEQQAIIASQNKKIEDLIKRLEQLEQK